MKRLVFVLVLLVLFSGCSSRQQTSQKPADLCVAQCRQSLDDGLDLSDGPCLSNQITEDWVCDVAHSPRTDQDNLVENHCEGFRNGTAHHFVEVDAACSILRVY